jgi:predicted RNA polymerase sigma factor
MHTHAHTRAITRRRRRRQKDKCHDNDGDDNDGNEDDEEEDEEEEEEEECRFVFLLANPEFYSHLASWRVVIRTPAIIKTKTKIVASLFGLRIKRWENHFDIMGLTWLTD